jgi:hypothetical protein
MIFIIGFQNYTLQLPGFTLQQWKKPVANIQSTPNKEVLGFAISRLVCQIPLNKVYMPTTQVRYLQPNLKTSALSWIPKRPTLNTSTHILSGG